MDDERQPIYVLAPTLPTDYARERKEQALAVGCSEEYAELLRLDVLARCVQVGSLHEASMMQRTRMDPA